MSTTRPTSPTSPMPLATADPAVVGPVTPTATGPGDPVSTPVAAPVPGSEGAAVPVPATPAGPLSADDLAAVRTVVLAAHPDTVPELVGGDSVAALLASVGPAREAFARVVATVRDPAAAGAAQAAMGPTVPSRPAVVPAVPAGSSPALAIDPDLIPPAEKLSLIHI